MNMSFGQREDSVAVQRAVAAAERRGMVLVAATGNDGSRARVDLPARLPTVLAVVGTDSQDRVMSTSSKGDEVDLAAPGRRVPSLARGGGMRTLSGTSMATPHVAGVAALLMSVERRLTPAQIRARLKETAEQLPGWSTREQGAGLVRADLALGVTDGPP